MLLLAFESSAKAASAALLRDGMLLGEYFQNSGQTHSRTLLKMAEDLNCSIPVTGTSHRYYQAAEDAGWGRQDIAAVIKLMEQENNG